MNAATQPGGGSGVTPATLSEPAFEVVAVRDTFAATAGWPAEPGSVQLEADGTAAVFHYAPGRWLVIGTAGVAARMEAASQAGDCTVVDVTGKWQALRAHGAESAARLASAANVDELLRGRGCAAAMLFGCPVILVREAAGVQVLIPRSYRDAFHYAYEQVRITPASGRSQS